MNCTFREQRIRRRGTCSRVPLALLAGFVAVVPASGADEFQPTSRDDDLFVSIEDGSALEGRSIEFKVLVSERRTVPLQVEWELAPGTAVEGVDYDQVNGGTLTIPPGDTDGVIRVRTVEDRTPEPDDEFTVSLVDVYPIPPDGAFLSESDSTATGTILNDDGDLRVPDADLRIAIERELDKRSGEAITPAEMGTLTRLSVDEHDRSLDLTGLEFATGLEVLNIIGRYPPGLTDLTRNLSALNHLARLEQLHLQSLDVRDVSPLARLTRLDYLNLRYNLISDLNPLADLTSLTRLDLGGNAIFDLDPLKRLTGLGVLHLQDNLISDLTPLEPLQGLRVLFLNNNLISDIAPLRGMTGLYELNLAFNSISDLSPIPDARSMRRLVLGNNAISDVAPLASFPGNGIYLYENPLSAASREFHIPNLRAKLKSIYDTSVWLSDASGVEGESLEFKVHLSPPATEPVTAEYQISIFSSAAHSADEADHSAGRERKVTIPAGDTAGTITVQTLEDHQEESHEWLPITMYGFQQTFPTGVSLRYDENQPYSYGLILESGLPVDDVPFIGSVRHETRQSLLRIINHHRESSTAVRIEAVDDSGNRPSPVTLSIRRGQAKQLTSGDLEAGNIAKGLSDGMGPAQSDWRLQLRSHHIEALAYMRTQDGLLTSMHDVVPLTFVGYFVPIFNPAKNPNQMSWLRLSNAGERTATVRITGVDDRGRSPGSEISFRLAPGRTQALTSEQLESGAGLNGALGRGAGKWRLVVASNVRIQVMNLLESPTGHLSNLSTLALPIESDDGTETTWRVPLFPSAMDAKGREGFVRVINRGERDASVRIKAWDNTRWDYEPVTLTVAAGHAAQFNSHDLETGNPDKGLPSGIGAGEGNWRLELTSGEALSVGAYIRTEDGFLTSMHDVVPLVDGEYFVPTFNPARNARQASSLRLINPGGRSVQVRVRAVDDRDKSPGDEVLLHLGRNSARTVSSRVLEAGLGGLVGNIGKGYGKWRLKVSSNRSVDVVNLMETPTGHLVNLSSRPAGFEN